LHRILHATEDPECDTEAMLQAVAEALKEAMQYDDLAAARIHWLHWRIECGEFPVAASPLSRAFSVAGVGEGVVELAYAVSASKGQQRVFVDEEITLLDRVVERLESTYQRRRETQLARERELIFRAIVTRAVEAIVLVDIEDLSFVEFNDSAASQ